jgi:MerR family transcriptional regulator/heat shock protein HspR
MGQPPPDDARGVYGISVAAELVGMGVQTLRLYETRGLVEPERSDGGTRRYSANDLDRIRRIGDLLDNGLNLAGIGMVINLQDENNQLRAEQAERVSRATPKRRQRTTHDSPKLGIQPAAPKERSQTVD